MLTNAYSIDKAQIVSVIQKC